MLKLKVEGESAGENSQLGNDAGGGGLFDSTLLEESLAPSEHPQEVSEPLPIPHQPESSAPASSADMSDRASSCTEVADKEETVAYDRDPQGNAALDSLMGAIRAGETKEFMEQAAGATLTKDNVQVHNAAIHKLQGCARDAAQDLSPKDKETFQKYEQALQDGFSSRSYWGAKFRQYLAAKPKSEQTDYKAMDRAKSEEYRVEWLRLQFKEFKESKVYSKSWQRVDTTKGEYMPFGRIVVEEGGWEDEEAIKGATNLTCQCLAMGGNWLMTNPQTKRVMFLRLSFMWQEHFSETWDHFQEDFGARTAVKRELEGAIEVQTPLKKSKLGVATGGKADANANGKGTGDDTVPPGAPPPPKEKDKLAMALPIAIKSRTKYLAAMSLGMTIVDQIEREEAWDWAKNEQNRGSLTKAIGELKDSLSAFGRQWVSEEPAVMKKRWGTAKEMFTTELEKFVARVEAPTKVLEAKTIGLQKRHVS